MRLLLDTNIVISHMQEEIPLPNLGTQFVISVITEAELLRYPKAAPKDLTKIQEWLASIEILAIDSAIARRAAQLGRTRKTKLPDLLIAATAIEHGLTLITRNTKDFQRIHGLIIRTRP